MQLLFSFEQNMRVEKILIQTLACQLSSTLMHLLFSFDQDMRVEKTLIQTLACQLSCTSCFCLIRTRELRKFSYKLALVNSHQLSCNSCSRLTRTSSQPYNWLFPRNSSRMYHNNHHSIQTFGRIKERLKFPGLSNYCKTIRCRREIEICMINLESKNLNIKS